MKKIKKLPPITKDLVFESLNGGEIFLKNNQYIIDYLKENFNAKSIYCLTMLPYQIHEFKTLVNGDLIVHIEFNPFDNSLLNVSSQSIDEYIDKLSDSRDKEFMIFAREIGQEKLNK